MRAQNIVVSLACVGVIACGPNVSTIDVGSEKVQLGKAGETTSLAAVPKDPAGKPVANVKLTYSSSDAAVASVDAQGVVTAVKSGDATVSVAFGEKVSKKVAVTVSIPARLTLEPAEAKLVGLGNTQQLTAKVTDELGRELAQEIAWETSAAAVATVTAGLVTAVDVGAATITARSGSLEQTAAVAVALPAVETLEVGEAALELKVGEPPPLAPVATDASGAEIGGVVFTYAVADEKVATVDAEGHIVPVGKGKTTVTITSGEKSATVELTVKK